MSTSLDLFKGSFPDVSLLQVRTCARRIGTGAVRGAVSDVRGCVLRRSREGHHRDRGLFRIHLRLA